MMPSVKKANEKTAKRRVSTSQPSPTRPVIKVEIANENGTVKPTKPRYKKTGWTATKTLSCNSAFGPAPSTGIGPTVAAKGSAGPSISAKKNTAIARPTSNAH